MAKLNINFRKYHRALLSEVLPFELPIIFNNDGFFLLHEHQDKKSLIHDLYKKIFEYMNIPLTKYTYTSITGNNDLLIIKNLIIISTSAFSDIKIGSISSEVDK